jgi:hypothetical protein
MTNDDWIKLIWLCLIRNRELILKDTSHKSLPTINTIQKILNGFTIKDCSLDFAEAYDQLYQIVKTRIIQAKIDPKKIRGMTMTSPNNLYIYHV